MASPWTGMRPLLGVNERRVRIPVARGPQISANVINREFRASDTRTRIRIFTGPVDEREIRCCGPAPRLRPVCRVFSRHICGHATCREAALLRGAPLPCREPTHGAWRGGQAHGRPGPRW